MIKPTVGRSIHVHRPMETSDPKQPEIGFITYVWSDRLINVAGYNHNGVHFALPSLALLQDDDVKPEGNFATWMPYQVEKAKEEQPRLEGTKIEF